MNNDYFSNDNKYDQKINRQNKIVIYSGFILFIVIALWILDVSGALSTIDYSAPNIYLNGNEAIDLVVNQPYDDSQIKAIDNKDGDITYRVIKKGIVDTTKPGTYVVSYIAQDKAGNKKTVDRTIKVIADTTGPQIKFTPNGNNKETGNHATKVDVVDPSGIKIAKYQWTTTKTKPTSFNNNFVSGLNIKTPDNQTGLYYLWVYAEDNKGNINIVRSGSFRIKHTAEPINEDTIPPTVVFSPNGNKTSVIKQSVIVTVNDSSGIKATKYQWTTNINKPTGESFVQEFTNGQAISSPINVDGNYYLWIYAEDHKGNKTIIRSNAYKLKHQDTNQPVDTTPPTVVFNPNGSDKLLVTQISKVTVSDPSGVQIAKYQWTTSYDKPSILSFTDNFKSGQTISSPNNVNGTYYLWIYAVDSKGNNTIARSNSFKIGQPITDFDTTPPTIIFQNNGNNKYAKSYSTKVNVSDKSGIKVSRYQWTNSISVPNVSNIKNNLKDGEIIKSPNDVTGQYYLWVYAEDKKGNKTVIPIRSNAFYLDNKEPSCTTSGFTSNWTNIDQTVKINCSDGNSGVSTCNDVSGYTASVTYSSSTSKKYSYNVVDKVGNTNTCNAMITIDKQKPTCASVVSNTYPKVTSWIKGPRKMSLKCEDEKQGSGLARCDDKIFSANDLYSYNKEQIFSSTIGAYTANIADKAGNTNTCTYDVLVDSTKPTIGFQPNGNSTSVVTQTVKVIVSDQNGIKVAKYLWANSTATPSSESFKTTFTSGQAISSPSGVAGTYYLWIYAEDTVGNNAMLRSNAYSLQQLSPDASLSKLSVSGATFIFNKDTYNYTSSTEVGYNVTDVNVSATPSHGKAVITGTGNFSLGVGTNVIKVQVTAEDKKTKKEYSVNLIKRDNGSRLHFINTGRTDSMLLESAGKYALVDASSSGISKNVINYLRKIGVNQLEFVVATHPHSDHIGGIPNIINNFSVKTLYTKVYDPRPEDFNAEASTDDKAMQNLYNAMIKAANNRNVTVVSDQICSQQSGGHSKCDPEGKGLLIIPTKYGSGVIPSSVGFGNLTIKFFNKDNTMLEDKCFKSGAACVTQNTLSIGTKVSLGTVSAFLAADINNSRGDNFKDNKNVETRIASSIGQVSLLKVGHHGVKTNSTNTTFANSLKPKIAVYTNNSCNTSPDHESTYINTTPVKNLRSANSSSAHYIAGSSGGASSLVATFSSSGISLTNIPDWNTAKCIKSKDSNKSSPWPNS